MFNAIKEQAKELVIFWEQVIERKGLDMVRRDWSLLSKELGDFCLGQILSGGYNIQSDLFCFKDLF